MILFVNPAENVKHGDLEKDTRNGLQQLDDVKYLTIGKVAIEDIGKYTAVVTIGWKPWRDYVNLYKRTRAVNKPFITISDGYIKRSVDSLPRYSSDYWAVSLNGLNTYSEATFSKCPSDRWGALKIELKPWTLTGEKLLVAHQHGDTWLGESRLAAFNKIMHMASTSGREILVRMHPNYWEGDWEAFANYEFTVSQARRHKNPISNDLDNIFCLMTHDSNAALDAIINGVPAFIASPSSILQSVCSIAFDSTNRHTPKREAWLNWIAYQQWTSKEIATGEPFRRLLSEIVVLKHPLESSVTNA